MSKAKVSGVAQGEVRDAAEVWLRNNDPHYASNKRRWVAPTTDALSRARSELNQRHPSLDGLQEAQPRQVGSYLKTPTSGADFHTYEQQADVPEDGE